ncbi:UDP-N-acetylmuramoylalanine-D-glutamate ligase [Corynebacterium glyciniphilum AJ 3170]|uniref:UDP-N-acetylmuramoylalanine--D-glutamate ligase n=1 Tax=Corynebacterium glyciniphilum AJ 3170 TaxID=1404245 RepID=X5DSW5_9CORY|nr:UDP-N-acetylmuramoyl-L-alanine--D-glutamate ligase [Corynebacterium glyciniphilum]AHW64389.1 UDP-N-acetylmuramoylalanine-D-glutamate ligase [Corynebacterium glyciniphilum AJ 3170]
MVNQVVEAMRGGNVLVAGAGVAGAGVARMLGDLECALTIADDNIVAAGTLGTETGARSVTVAEALAQLGDGCIDLVITSPGWRPDGPVPAAAAEAGVAVIGDVEAAWLADRAALFGEPRTWLAVTGTNGKTTTTAMLDAILQADGRRSRPVGNIGTPPGEALLADPRIDVLAAEVSSFQLHWAPEFGPDAGCVLNLAEDHLDWHGSFENYAADKMRVLTGAVAVIAVDDPVVTSGAQAAPGDHRAFTTGDPGAVPSDLSVSVVTGVRDGRIVELDSATGRLTDLASAEGISPPGPAGVADAAAAAALARSIGVSAEAVAAALADFRVQAHRGQVVAETDGVRWVDNSKATNPHAASAALRGLDRVVWVAGGQLKGAAVDDLVAEVAPGLRGAVVLGVDRQILADALAAVAPDLPVTVVDDTDPVGAMTVAVAAARSIAGVGDSVVLAPAAASLDMYEGMSQRGDLFAELAGRTAGKDSGR